MEKSRKILKNSIFDAESNGARLVTVRCWERGENGDLEYRKRVGKSETSFRLSATSWTRWYKSPHWRTYGSPATLTLGSVFVARQRGNGVPVGDVTYVDAFSLTRSSFRYVRRSRATLVDKVLQLWPGLREAYRSIPSNTILKGWNMAELGFF